MGCEWRSFNWVVSSRDLKQDRMVTHDPRDGGFPGGRHGWGGLIIIFLELADATQEVGGAVGWGGDDNVPCTCTHGRCYARFSCLSVT